MAVAPAQAAARMSWTQTSVAELAIEDMLEAWDWAGQAAAFVPHEDEPAHGAVSAATARSRLPRTSSLLQLAVEPLAPFHPCKPSARSKAPSSSSSASPVEALDPGFDHFNRAPIPSGLPAPRSPSPPPPPRDLPTSTSGDLVSLDDIFGAAPGRSSPFPTLSSTTHLPPSAPPRPAGLFKNVRALAERLDANLPPAPVLVTSLPPPSHTHPPPSARARPSVAPSSASVASGSTGSGSFSGGSGSSTSTARAENRPLAMYPRPPPAPRGAQQYPRPPPAPKEKKGRKGVQGEGAGAPGENEDPAAARKEGARGWMGGLSVRGGGGNR